MTDELEESLEDETDTDSSADSGADGDQGPDGDADDPKDKRINDLMSKWQKSEARAKAAEAKLAKSDADGVKTDVIADEGDDGRQWIEAAKTMTRDQVFASDPRFAEYGFESSSITGASPAEMRESAKRLSDMLDTASTKMRAEILQKHGLSPEVKSGAPGGKPKGWDAMSSDEFEKELIKAKANW